MPEFNEAIRIEPPLDQPDAWREIARKIVEGDWQKYGICMEVWALWVDDRITHTTYRQMIQRVEGHVELHHEVSWGSHAAYAYRKGEEAEARAFACLWMALEAEAELRERVEDFVVRLAWGTTTIRGRG